MKLTSVVGLSAVLVFGMVSCGHRESPRMAAFPRWVLWAWEEPQDLRFLRGQAYGVAFYAKHVVRAANILGADIDGAGAEEIAGRSRGTPRIANRLLRRVRDVAEVEGDGRIDAATARAGLELFGIDSLGLDKVDRSILTSLCARFGGGPVGLSTLAIAVAEPSETVEDVYEPYLIQQGMLVRTPRGRVATAAAWRHLGMVPPPSAMPGAVDPSLFE